MSKKGSNTIIVILLGALIVYLVSILPKLNSITYAANKVNTPGGSALTQIGSGFASLLNGIAGIKKVFAGNVAGSGSYGGWVDQYNQNIDLPTINLSSTITQPGDIPLYIQD